jgi:hypothetical protein
MDEINERSRNERDADCLRGNAGFGELPSRFRELVLKSPHASADFASFYASGGRVVGDPNETIALYRSEPQREIRINQAQYEFAKTPAGAHLVDGMFSTIAHEIGHDKDRNASFPHGTAEEYVQFRSEKEAKAIFNAFPIFADLEKNQPSFKPVWRDLGYSPMGLAWRPLYDKWKDGTFSDADVVKEMAKSVVDYPYTRNDGLIDHSGDGRVTQRDGYLRDYQRLLRHPDSSSVPIGSSGRELFQELRDQLPAAFAQHGPVPPAADLDRIAACLAVECRRGGIEHPDHVVVGRPAPDGSGRHVFAVEGELNDPAHRRAGVPGQAAAQTPLEESLPKLAALQSQPPPASTPVEQAQETQKGIGPRV